MDMGSHGMRAFKHLAWNWYSAIKKRRHFRDLFSYKRRYWKKNFEGSGGEGNYNKELLDILLFSPDLKNTLISVNECVIEILTEAPLIYLLLLPQRTISLLLAQLVTNFPLNKILGENFIKSY